MALTRKFLSALGIEADKVDEIIAAHTETVEALKAQRDEFKASHDKLQSVQAELDALKKATDGESPYKVKYEALKEEFDKYKTDAAEKEKQARLESAYRALLKQAGISDKRIGSVLRVSDLSKVKLDKDGKVEGADELLKGIREEWSDFIPTQEQHGVETPTPPKDNGGGKYTSRDEIMKIKDATERQKAIAANIELFQGKGE